MSGRRTLPVMAIVAATGLVLAGCSSSPGSGSSSSSSSSSSSPSSSPTTSVPQVDASAFTADFSVMTELKDLAAKGKG